ncbi:superoxide dismutase family protein [Bacillus sp. SCS-153A]|uniref:superoxide dismutase family protein n=1 Tax=Rossellomorea sedimentorum TaxID=3115294 RepID=UPI003905DE17
MTYYYGFQQGYHYGYPPYRSVPSISYAQIEGGPLAPNLKGYVFFRQVPNGTEVHIEVNGLPEFKEGKGDQNPIGPHGFHLHESGSCEVGDEKEPFKAAGGHWNPTDQPHGNHAGDFPVLFSNNGYARMAFFTNKFSPKDVVGKAVIIHQNPDDYRTQPAGDAGKRLACGSIVKYQ